MAPRRGRHRIGEGGLSWLSLPQTRDMLANYLNELPHLLYDEWAETAEDGVMDDFDDEVVFCLSALWRTTNDQVHSLGKLLSWVDVGAHSACVELLRYQADRAFLSTGQNHFAPYYCAAILGSLLHPDLEKRRPRVVRDVVDDGLVDLAVGLAKGALCFEE